MFVQLLQGLGAQSAEDFALAATNFRSALALEGEGTDGAATDQPVFPFFAGRAAVHLGDGQALRRSTRAAATRARAAGALGPLAHVLGRLGYGDLWAGRWAAVATNAHEGLKLARDLDQHHLGAHQLALLAMTTAYRGDEDDCRGLAAEGRDLASKYGLMLVADFADWALALLELGLRRVEEALSRSRGMSTTIVVSWAGLDRIEAAVRAGDQDAARRWLAAFESGLADYLPHAYPSLGAFPSLAGHEPREPGRQPVHTV